MCRDFLANGDLGGRGQSNLCNAVFLANCDSSGQPELVECLLKRMASVGRTGLVTKCMLAPKGSPLEAGDQLYFALSIGGMDGLSPN